MSALSAGHLGHRALALLHVAMHSPLHWLGALIVALTVAVVWLALRPVRRYSLRKFRGPPLMPVIGNMADVMKAGGIQGSIMHIWQPTYGRVFRIMMGCHPVVVVQDARLFKPVMTTTDRLVLGSYVPRTLLPTADVGLEDAINHGNLVNCPGNAFWKTLRANWSAWINHSEGLMEYSVTMRNAIGRLSGVLQRHAETGAELDAAALMGNLTFDVVGTTAFGVEFDTQSTEKVTHLTELVKAARIFFANTGVRPTDTTLMDVLAFCVPELCRVFWTLDRLWSNKQQAFEHARQLLCKASLAILRDAKGSRNRAVDGETSFHSLKPKPGSFADKVRDMHYKGTPLNEAQLIAQVRTFMLAGYDTTASMLSFTCYLLGRHTDVQDRLAALVRERFGREGSLPEADAVESLEYLDAVCKESLRLYPPAPTVSRRTGKDEICVGDLTLPPHTNVFISNYAMQRDPDYWTEPETFRPERFLGDKPEPSHPDAYAPFGGGPRMCVGRKFALLEAKLALVEMVRKYQWELAEGQGEPKLRITITMGPDGPIRLIIKERK